MEPRTRIAITLDDAATKVPLLTDDEFNALSLVYLLRYSAFNLNSPEDVGQIFRNSIFPFLDDSIGSTSSLWHIEAQSCGSVGIGSVGLTDLIRKSYGGVLSAGLTREALDGLVPGKERNLDLLVTPVRKGESKYRLTIGGDQNFAKAAMTNGLTAVNCDDIFRNVSSVSGTEEEMKRLLPDRVNDVTMLFSKWNTSLQHLNLTSVGIAIAHANAHRQINFEAPLDIWIK